MITYYAREIGEGDWFTVSKEEYLYYASSPEWDTKREFSMEECPICEDGYLHACSEMIKVEHAGHTGKIESLYSQCDECGSETATATQVRINKRSMTTFQSEVENFIRKHNAHNSQNNR